MCCALIAFCIALMGATRTRLKLILVQRFHLLANAVIIVAAVASSAFAAEHIGHYINRATDNERSVLAEILAQPICSGTATNKNKSTQLSYADHQKLEGQ